MLQAFGNHAEGERLHTSDGLVPILAIRHDAGQGRYLGEPAAVDFLVNFDRERHGGNVPFGPAVSQGDGPDAGRTALAPHPAPVIAIPLIWLSDTGLN